MSLFLEDVVPSGLVAAFAAERHERQALRFFVALRGSHDTIDAALSEGDWFAVDRTQECRPGDWAVAWFDGPVEQVLVRVEADGRLVPMAGFPRLSDPAWEPLALTVRGVVVGHLRRGCGAEPEANRCDVDTVVKT